MAEFEKVIGTITVNKNILQVDNQFAGNMFSSDLTYTVNFSDDFWTGFDILEWYAANSVVGETVVCEYDSANKKLKIPYGAYIKNGPLYISMRGIKDSVKYASNILVLLVGENINIEENDIVDDPSWLDKVQAIIDDVFVSKYDPQYEVLVQKVEKQISANKELLDKTQEQQNQIDNAIDIMGDYEIVQANPTQIRFKKGDGNYGNTVNLGDNLASKSMVNAGYDTYSGNSYSGSASDYGIEIGEASGNYKQEGTPTPGSPVEPKFFEPKHVYSYSKNMFDFNVLKNNYVIHGTKTYTNDSITLTATANDCYDNSYTENGKFLIKVRPNTKYTILYKRNSSIAGRTYVFEYDINKNMITPHQSSDISHLMLNFTFTTKENCEYIKFRVGVNSKGQTCTFSDFMILEGEWTWETVGKFIPYKGNSTTPLDITLRALPNGVCDTYENGVITRRVEYIEFDGSEDEGWKLNSTGTSPYNRFLSPLISNLVLKSKDTSTVANMICNRYKIVSSDSTYSREEGICVATDGNILIYNEEYSTKTIDEWKQYLQSNPIRVWYQLATPTTEEVELPVIPSYFPYTNAWHDSEVEASDLTWNILAGQYGSGQTTIKKDEAVLTELDLNTERTISPTTVKVQLKDTNGNVFYIETSADNVYLKGTDGSEISQQNLNEKFGQLINLVAFYSASPVNVLTDLKKYITTIS